MREILFRGKCVDTGVWYEGYYIQLHKTTHCCLGCPDPDNDIHQIVFERMTDWELPNQHYRVDVDPETVGQFTGLTDKNGKNIFEWDIVRCIRTFCDGKEMIGHIIYKDCCFCVKEKKDINQPAMDLCSDFEVIGNIHDNPELLEG